MSNSVKGKWKRFGDVIKWQALFMVLPLLMCSSTARAQSRPYVSKVWVSDQGDGTYRNPVLHADYSDPDAIRVGDDYYLTASSFEEAPGLPILHSKDLVNWRIIGHALPRLLPDNHFQRPRHGEGVWAPSLRYRKGEFYLYYPDPDFGIYLVKARKPEGPWTAPVLVAEGKGLIDPCPLWDEDGSVYLVHAYAGSRAGIKSVLAIRRLNAAGTKAIDEGRLVYDGHDTDPTIEGPKIYKRKGQFYIFAPAGGVSTGWQLVLRSKSIYGPYERKVVMDQGRSPVNGPHQGAWVQTQTGEDWFLHFQDKEAYGRILHLQPLKWVNDWPVIGADPDGDGKGEPVLQHRKPNVGRSWPGETPFESDEFNGNALGRQWQWKANPKSTWAMPDPAKGVLRLFSDRLPDSARNLWEAPSVLVQKFPAEEFTVTTKVSFRPHSKLDERAGLIVSGLSYAALYLRHGAGGNELAFGICTDADKGSTEQVLLTVPIHTTELFLRLKVEQGGRCRFSFATDGLHFTEAGSFTATAGRWIGARMGLFCVRSGQTNDAGWMDVDWWRVERNEE